MKKIILSLLIAASANSYAQSVTLYLDSTSQSQYCNLQPFLFRTIDADSVRHLCISYWDNGSKLIIYYKLTGNTGILFESNITLTGADYSEWSSDSYLYNYVANKLHLNILD